VRLSGQVASVVVEFLSEEAARVDEVVGLFLRIRVLPIDI
jgi:hypothetical protein